MSTYKCGGSQVDEFLKRNLEFWNPELGNQEFGNLEFWNLVFRNLELWGAVGIWNFGMWHIQF